MPPRVFLSKSAQVIENKRRAREKERKERKRVCKLLCTKGLENPNAEGWERKGQQTVFREICPGQINGERRQSGEGLAMTMLGKRERKFLQTAGAGCFLTITIYCTRREDRGELDERTKKKQLYCESWRVLKYKSLRVQETEGLKVWNVGVATLLKTSRTQVGRLLNPKSDITLSGLQRAAAMVGRRVRIELV